MRPKLAHRHAREKTASGNIRVGQRAIVIFFREIEMRVQNREWCDPSGEQRYRTIHDSSRAL